MKEMVGGCCVCSDERGWSENPLVYCDGHGCNVAVHQACYGIVSVPTGPWFCRKCESQERAARVGGTTARKSQKLPKSLDRGAGVARGLGSSPPSPQPFQRCELCPQKDGALKRTDTGGWCHVVCALFIPEAWFGNVQTMEPIILKGVPPERFNKTCYVCEEQGRETKAQTGACMQCNKNGCKHHFHVTCAQAQGLLCEEQGNYMDNVKYCGYCSLHYKKLKKDSHIKVIPAFKPIPTEGGTPENTPEKSGPSRQDRRRERPTKSQPQLSPSQDDPSMTSPPPTLTAAERSQYNVTSPNPTKDGSVTDIKTTGKFTTANFRETTITPSPANFADFSSPGSSSSAGGDGSTPTHGDSRERKGGSTPTHGDARERKRDTHGDRTPSEKRTPSKQAIDVYDSDFIDSDTKPKLGILGSPSGRSVAAAKESKYSNMQHAAKTDRSPSRPATTTVSTATAATTTVTLTTANSTAVTMTTAATTTTSASFNYSFESFLSSRGGYPEKPGQTPTVTDKDAEGSAGKRPRSRSSEKQEKKKNKKTKAYSEEPPPMMPRAPSPAGTSTPELAGTPGPPKGKTVKDLLAVSAVSPPPPAVSQSPASVAPAVVQPPPPPPPHTSMAGRPRKPGKRRKNTSESGTLPGMPTLHHQGAFDTNPFHSAAGAGTTPISLSSLHKQGSPLHDNGDGPPILSQQVSLASVRTAPSPVRTAPSPMQSPNQGMSQAMPQTSQAPPLSGQAPPLSGQAPPLSGPAPPLSGQGPPPLFSAAVGVAATTQSASSVHASGLTNDCKGAPPDLTEGLTNGPTSLLGPARPLSSLTTTIPAATTPTTAAKGLLSPGRGNNAADNHAQLPTSMEQLLERQWDQGSQFLMEQGQHFDIASLLNCLHQLRQENQRLEEHINNLTARRDQLLAVNARLSLPLTPLNAIHSTNSTMPTVSAGGATGAFPVSTEGHAAAGRRINSYMTDGHGSTAAATQELVDLIEELLTGSSSRNPLRSPAQNQAPPPRSPAHSQPQPTTATPTHNHLPASHNQSPVSAPPASTTQGHPHPSPDAGSLHPPPLSAPGGDLSPGGPPLLPPGLTEQQRQMMVQHQHQLQLGAQGLTPITMETPQPTEVAMVTSEHSYARSQAPEPPTPLSVLYQLAQDSTPLITALDKEQRQQLLYQMAASQQLPPGIFAPMVTAPITMATSARQPQPPPPHGGLQGAGHGGGGGKGEKGGKDKS